MMARAASPSSPSHTPGAWLGPSVLSATGTFGTVAVLSAHSQTARKARVGARAVDLGHPVVGAADAGPPAVAVLDACPPGRPRVDQHQV
jgi:hypothetical protein